MTDETNAEWPLPSPDALGPLVGADDVADALETTIETWSPYYVAMISGRLEAAKRIGGRSQPKAPLSPFGKWRNEVTERNIGTGSPAAFEVRVTGTVGEPERKATGLYIVTWRAQVNIQYWGTAWREARDGTSWYEKAVRWSVLQHKSLGGFAESTRWIGVAYAGVDHAGTRTQGQALMALNVKVANAVDDTRGPQEVPVPPLVPEQDPTVATTSVSVTKSA